MRSVGSRTAGDIVGLATDAPQGDAKLDAVDIYDLAPAVLQRADHGKRTDPDAERATFFPSESHDLDGIGGVPAKPLQFCQCSTATTRPRQPSNRPAAALVSI